MNEITPLRRVLDEEGRRQSWLAAKIGMSRADLNRVVNRGMHVSDDTQQKISAALGRTVEELFPTKPADDERQAA